MSALAEDCHADGGCELKPLANLLDLPRHKLETRMRLAIAFLSLFAVAACGDVTVQTGPAPAPAREPVQTIKRTGGPQSVNDFRVVVRRVEPVAERACRQLSPQRNCDFRITIDDRPGLPPNAYQTYDKSGRPLIAFTPALFREMRNRDELAFALAHEAAHHIEGHIQQTQTSARTGAILGAVLGSAIGLDQACPNSSTRASKWRQILVVR